MEVYQQKNICDDAKKTWIPVYLNSIPAFLLNKVTDFEFRLFFFLILRQYIVISIHIKSTIKTDNRYAGFCRRTYLTFSSFVKNLCYNYLIEIFNMKFLRKRIMSSFWRILTKFCQGVRKQHGTGTVL